MTKEKEKNQEKDKFESCAVLTENKTKSMGNKGKKKDALWKERGLDKKRDKKDSFWREFQFLQVLGGRNSLGPLASNINNIEIRLTKELLKE